MDLLAYLGWKVVDRIGPVSPHGLGIAAGYAAGGSLLARRAERLYGVAREHVWNMLMWAVLGVVVGARLFYVVGHIADYIPSDPLGIFRVWEGGIVLYGGIFGGIAAAYPYARAHKLPFLKLLDAAAPGFPIGLIFGRIGDLIIGDHLGGPTTFFLGWEYQGGRLPDRFLPIGSVVHQTALYDLINVVILLPVVLWLGRKRRADGFLIMFAATWYAVARFITDFARTQAATSFGLHGTQWVSLALFIFGVGFLVRLSRKKPALHPEIPLTSSEEEGRMLDEGAPLAPAEQPEIFTGDDAPPPPTEP